MEKLILFLEIQQLKEKGFSKSAIARKLGISRNTVNKYLNMTFEEATDWVASLGTRTKKLDSYQDKILSWLKNDPDMSSAQVEDWLKEHYPDLVIGGSTVRNYVIRNGYEVGIDNERKISRLLDQIDDLVQRVEQLEYEKGELQLELAKYREIPN